MLYKIVETDNHNRDYPGESEVNLPLMRKDAAEHIAESINAALSDTRYWKVEEASYTLSDSFEP